MTAIGTAAIIILKYLHYDGTETYLPRTTSTIYVFGIGFADLAADAAIGAYYTCELTDQLVSFLAGCVRVMVTFRVVQWLFCAYVAVAFSTTKTEVLALCPAFVLWMHEEYKEWVIISGITDRVRKTVQQNALQEAKDAVPNTGISGGKPQRLVEHLMRRKSLKASISTDRLASQWGLGEVAITENPELVSPPA